MSRRYALYWAPSPGSALWRTGCGILGRDAATGEELSQPGLPGVDPHRFRDVTQSPRLYGLHATLKAPFRLAPDTSQAQLRGTLKAFAAQRHPFQLPGMALTPVGRFLALAPQASSTALDVLARDCVEAFDHFRAPLNAIELEKRLSSGLSDRQRELLSRWGYPYVLEEYRFHMTLTGNIQDAHERQLLRQGLASLLDESARDELAAVMVTELCLFEQSGQGQPFKITGRYPFGGSG